MGLHTVAVFVDSDTDSPFVREALEAVRIDSYLDADAIVAAARNKGSGAIHPGYGFLAENAEFAESVIEAGIAWIGPSPESIAAMGDKIEAKKRAIDADVPVLASTDATDAFGSIGFPLLVKAAAGGGGKGMRIVESEDALDEAVSAARREALSGFGDDRVFAERYIPRSRHIEIQVLGDGHGNLVHLGERECSIQRRHQKIIEESPSPFVDPKTRQAMGAAALRLASAIGYRSAGTVEFLVDDETGEFFFLEVNTRLQVEHPVTEEVTGIDLVREQIRVAMGEPLSFDQASITATGHAIEARLYAEDPQNDFLPATGTVDAFDYVDTPSIRWDCGIEQGSLIGVEFDPMIAKVTATAPTRREATSALAHALETLVLGGVTTNRDFLANVLRSRAFVDGDTTTDFIERHAPALSLDLDARVERRFAVAAAMWLQHSNRVDADTLPSMPSGWRLGRLPAERVDLRTADREISVHYRPRRDGSFALGVDAEEEVALVHGWSPYDLDFEIDGHRNLVWVNRTDDRIHLTGPGGHVSFTLPPRFSPPRSELPGGTVAAPMPGKVIELRVNEGDTVEAGDVVAVLEAMKMENHLRAPEAGMVADLSVAVGDQIEKDARLMTIDSGSPSPDQDSSDD